MRQGYNLHMDKTYSGPMLKNLEEKVIEKGMLFDFPHLDENRHMAKTKLKVCNENQPTLMNFM